MKDLAQHHLVLSLFPGPGFGTGAASLRGPPIGFALGAAGVFLCRISRLGGRGDEYLVPRPPAV